MTYKVVEYFDDYPVRTVATGLTEDAANKKRTELNKRPRACVSYEVREE